MEILDELLNQFADKYYPATKKSESDDLLSSQDVLNLFNSVAKIELDELYKGLKNHGFQTTIINNQFLWMVKETKSPN